jgi:hypothetical protein
MDSSPKLGMREVLLRTLEVYHYIHMEPVIRAWFRINTEVTAHSDNMAKFGEWLQNKSLDDQILKEILDEVQTRLGKLGGATGRLDVPMIEIEPSSSLGDSLDFDQQRIRDNIKIGYTDMLKALKNKSKIDEADFQNLSNSPLFE